MRGVLVSAFYPYGPDEIVLTVLMWIVDLNPISLYNAIDFFTDLFCNLSRFVPFISVSTDVFKALTGEKVCVP